MRTWGIRKQILALSLLPTLVVTIVLTSYFTMTQFEFISESQIQHGNTIARQLAPVSEYAVFSGNIDSIKPTIKSILSDKNIVEIKVIDKNNKILLSLKNKQSSKKDQSIWHKYVTSNYTTFREPIKTQSIDINLPNETNAGNNDEIIGYIELTLTSTNINAIKLRSAVKGSLLSTLILFIILVFALRISKRISRPVKILTSTVKQISSGDYQTRINEISTAEFGVLESCVNVMAEELESTRDNLEEKIEESTKELHETMEELEIRNAELDIARSNAIYANKAKTKFLASMSHELRTPLGGILGFSELLEKTELKDQQLDYSEIIKKSANNLLHILDGILDLSKIESGKLDINFSEFNIIDIVEDVIDLLIPLAYEKNIELFYYIDKHTPKLVNTDPARIRQILINIVGNAIKFTDIGFVALHISSEPKQESYSELIFSVTDTGIGMKKSQQNRLFEAFTQADSSIEEKFGGTGLGLVISKKLAQLLHGDIDFESQYSKGSTFTVRIPVECKQQSYKPFPSLLGKRICLVDSQKTCIIGIQNMLDLWGCCTDIYTQTPDELSSYDLVIINLCKSCMNDDKVKSFIPNEQSPIPILAIVSTRSHKELNEIMNYGFDSAVFHSSKNDYIQQVASNLIENDMTPIITSTPSNKSTFSWSELKILVVDDNDINLKLAEIVLTKNNAQVVTANNGQQSIDISKEQHFDLILMDIQMPEMDGFQSSKLIRKNKKNNDTTIIALTANALATKKSHLIEQSGINDVLIKPINETSIQNMINKWLLKNESSQTQIQPKFKTDFFSKPEALKLAAGNSQLANELTAMLIKELPEYLTAINNALSLDDINELKHTTHKLHGASRCCGTPALRYAAEQLENDINNEIIEQLEASSHLLINEIKKLIAAEKSELMI